MNSINTFYSSTSFVNGATANATQNTGKATDSPGVATVAPETETNISSLASRLSQAAQDFGTQIAGLTRKDLASKVQNNIDKILYTLDDSHMAAAALEIPQPNDAQSSASAKAATAFVNDSSAPNPFAGLSREQLATIANDGSGTFTTNERRAAFMQAYKEEQAWRTKVVEEAQREHAETGKLANFYKAAREHFEHLPLTEQVLYPASYTAELTSKINLNSGNSGAAVSQAGASQ